MKIITAFVIALLTIGNQPVSGQGNFNALSWRQDKAFNSYLMRDVHQQYADRKVELRKALQSKKAIMQYRNELRKRYKAILGDFPEKQKLNAKVLNVSQQNGFRVETVIFESLPKRYVTANLYLPQGKGPFPASLGLCGHGIKGKSGSSAAVLMALNGIAVLVVDPIGQGERIQLLDEDGKPATRGATTEHTLLNAGCNLLGSSLAAYELWDNHRAIDYLETRSDIDKSRLGAYGSSGGGTQTTYLIGFEDRLKVASICSYFSQRERVLELDGTSDGCQHVPGEGSAHIEIADWVTMFAPKPVLIMSGRYDFVDYWGAVQGVEELKNVYETMGKPDAIKQFSTESGHGMPKVKREALTTWFRKWLIGDPTPIYESEIIRVPERDMQCTSSGQVITTFEDAVTIQKYNRDLAKKWSEKRTQFMMQTDSVVRQKVFNLLGMNISKEEITPEQTGFSKGRTYDIHKYQIIRKGQMPLPCVVVIPDKIAPDGNVILYLNETGKNKFLGDATTLNMSVNQGNIIVVADLRGYGESSDPSQLNDIKYWNREYRNPMISLHIGKPIVGQRVTDIISLVDFISTDPIFGAYSIKLKANGSYGPVAVHAAYLDKRISETKIFRSIKSYQEFLDFPMQKDMYTNVIPGVLKYYDIKDLVDKAGKGRIRFTD